MTNKKDTGEQKRKVSVALEYVPGEEAPKIIASGKVFWRKRLLSVPRKRMCRCMKTVSLPIRSPSWNRRYDTAGNYTAWLTEILVFVDDMDRLRSKVKKTGK